MDYASLVAVLKQERPAICGCCNDGIKGHPRITHPGDGYKIWCSKCYRGCRPFTEKTGCYRKGGVSLIF